jgi:hypothetical protein
MDTVEVKVEELEGAALHYVADRLLIGVSNPTWRDSCPDWHLKEIVKSCGETQFEVPAELATPDS